VLPTWPKQRPPSASSLLSPSLADLSAKVVSRLHDFTSKTLDLPESFRLCRSTISTSPCPHLYVFHPRAIDSTILPTRRPGHQIVKGRFSSYPRAKCCTSCIKEKGSHGFWSLATITLFRIHGVDGCEISIESRFAGPQLGENSGIPPGEVVVQSSSVLSGLNLIDLSSQIALV
jgi:hypothetical protein